MIALGLMAGTSLDGVDAALVRITPHRDAYVFEVQRFATIPYELELRARLLEKPDGPAAIARLNRSVGEAFAAAAKRVSESQELDYVASHGQTIYHDGSNALTLQIGDPFVLREALDATVVYDFRSADCAAGGHGAPLMPYVDALLFADAREFRVAANIGGIANITALPPGGTPQDAVGFDSGPGNALIDAFVGEKTGGESLCDLDGRFASAGSVDARVLRSALADPYFAAPVPKSTGREYFGAAFLAEHELAALDLSDGCATLSALTAVSLAQAIRGCAPRGARIVLSGGGVHNCDLVSRIREQLPDYTIVTSGELGIDPDAKEALGFAVLGFETLRERPAGLPRATGARYPAVLGAIAPRRLASLLEKVRREVDEGTRK